MHFWIYNTSINLETWFLHLLLVWPNSWDLKIKFNARKSRLSHFIKAPCDYHMRTAIIKWFAVWTKTKYSFVNCRSSCDGCGPSHCCNIFGAQIYSAPDNYQRESALHFGKNYEIKSRRAWRMILNAVQKWHTSEYSYPSLSLCECACDQIQLKYAKHTDSNLHTQCTAGYVNVFNVMDVLCW